MPYEEITGDLFKQDVKAYGHGVNCCGVMGGGISYVFRNEYPEMYTKYVELCDQGELNLGDIFCWQETDPAVYNLATQFLPGADAELEAIQNAVAAMLDHATYHAYTKIGIPRIGAGIGGLVWSDVEDIIIPLAENSPIDLLVVTLPEVTAA